MWGRVQVYVCETERDREHETVLAALLHLFTCYSSSFLLSLLVSLIPFFTPRPACNCAKVNPVAGVHRNVSIYSFLPFLFYLFHQQLSLLLLLLYIPWCPTMHPGNKGEEDRQSAICSVRPSRRQQTNGGWPCCFVWLIKGIQAQECALSQFFLKVSPHLGVTHLLKFETKLSHHYLHAFVPTHAQKLSSPLAATSAEKKHNIKGSVMHESPSSPSSFHQCDKLIPKLSWIF